MPANHRWDCEHCVVPTLSGIRCQRELGNCPLPGDMPTGKTLQKINTKRLLHQVPPLTLEEPRPITMNFGRRGTHELDALGYLLGRDTYGR